MRGPLHPTRIDIPIETRIQVIDIIGVTLATSIDLYSQTKQAHWNIKDSRFFFLHKFFDKLAKPLPDISDSLAERINQLGGTSLGTIRLSTMSSLLTEFPYTVFDGDSYLEALADRYAIFSKNLRDSANILENLGDLTTQSFFLDLALDNDQRLWFIESHLEGN